jgi:hypothetical protein
MDTVCICRFWHYPGRVLLSVGLYSLSLSLSGPFSVTVDDDNLLVIDTDYFSREGLDCRLLAK